MKAILVIILVCQSWVAVNAQKVKSYKINPGKKITEAIPREDIYLYPVFTNGTVFKRNDQFSKAPLNYNSLLGEMQFIDHNGDTLSIADHEIIKSIVIRADTFYYYKVCLKLVEDFGNVKLAVRQFIDFANRQKMGGHGELSSASISTYSEMSSQIGSKDISPYEILTLTKYQVFYISDKFNSFKVANKKNLYALFPKKEKILGRYLKERKVDFFNEQDLKYLIRALN
jgi:hypothetical protein